MASPQELTDLEQILREAAGVVAAERKRLQTNLKSDGSIVTNADKAVEAFLRKELPIICPAAIWGEEEGFALPNEHGLWVVDPIDGTSNFNFGSPLWGISIALLRDGVLDLGGIYLPDLDEMYLSGKGMGATWNGNQLAQLKGGPIKPSELVSYCEGVIRLIPGEKIPGKMRCAGAFVIDGTFVATGRYRGLVGHRERLYDIGASVLINRELGAEICYADGDPFYEKDLITEQKIERAWLIFPPDSNFRI